MDDLLPGFADERVRTEGAEIRVRHGGEGPPLLLLHGNPATHVTWHKIAPQLAERFHVVATDLRGYGDSSAPEPGENYEHYTFRALAADQLEIMSGLGYERFFVVGHDRGARVTHRMALDHPERVAAAGVLDILPTHHLLSNPSLEWAVKTWHWTFMAQPPDLPEGMMGAVSPRWFMERKLNRGGRGLGFFDPRAFDEYVRCFDEKTIRGSCHEYRATITADFPMDDADVQAGNVVEVPMLALWGERSYPADVHGDVLDIWRRYAPKVEGKALDCGHYVPEEAPEQTLAGILDFLDGRPLD